MEPMFWKVSSPHGSVYVQRQTVRKALQDAEEAGLTHPLVIVSVTPEEAYGRLWGESSGPEHHAQRPR